MASARLRSCTQALSALGLMGIERHPQNTANTSKSKTNERLIVSPFKPDNGHDHRTGQPGHAIRTVRSTPTNHQPASVNLKLWFCVSQLVSPRSEIPVLCISRFFRFGMLIRSSMQASVTFVP